MRAIEAARLLERISQAGEVDLTPAESVLLDELVRDGLARWAPDASTERARLLALKDELASLARAQPNGSQAAAALAERTRALRTQILDLSAIVAQGDGAARVVSAMSAGPYRGGAGGARRDVTLTLRGRALAANLGPRAERAAALSLEEFEAHMVALRKLFAWRAGRAMTIVQRIGGRAGGVEPSVLSTIALGLSGLRQPEDVLSDAFLVLYTAMRQTYVASAGPATFTAAQDASAAECIMLAASDATAIAYDARTAPWFAHLRQTLLRTHCAGRTEDALDAALLLVSVPEADHAAHIGRAASLAGALSARDVPIPLSLALLASREAPSAHLVGEIVESYRGLSADTREPMEALVGAVVVASSGGDATSQCARLREVRQYLERFSPSGMTVAAALLTLLDGETTGLLDDLRLASAEVQRYQLASGGTESMMHAIKLLVQSSLLAHGADGDPEEGIALVARAVPSAIGLGAHALSATLPMVLSAVTTFHRPLLDAALVYERAYQPTHSDYVFGRGYGSGASTGHRHHRSIGWG